MAATGDGAFEGAIPPQPEGEVVQYRIVVRTDDGSEWSLPQNRADPRYELFVGAVTELYCTDFESDPAVDGWTHGLRSGADGEGADDWQWDVPAGRAASGDPDRAFSGERAFGNDLGHDNFNGSYQPDKVNFARMPVVDASGYSVVRLQYRRWLNVEDGSYDRATIYANGEPVWQNLATEDGTTHHQDREWRFHDVDLTRTLAPDGTVQVEFELASDGGLEFGGWTVDDVCIVAYAPSVCGDGVATGIEQCDDGPDNADAPDACRTNCTLPMCGDGIIDAGEECDDGNADPGDDCLDDCTRPDAAPGSADCGCRAGGTPHRPWTAPALVAALAVVALRRRARRRRPRGGAPVPGGPSAPSPLL
ncbi:MAG: DUF4215 domain-containing protein [Deltaproteobacteria bacterium]|nr:MAG: DUF4215 domain-containing protein [Deltaproteobacteria bacterium]